SSWSCQIAKHPPPVFARAALKTQTSSRRWRASMCAGLIPLCRQSNQQREWPSAFPAWSTCHAFKCLRGRLSLPPCTPTNPVGYAAPVSGRAFAHSCALPVRPPTAPRASGSAAPSQWHLSNAEITASLSLLREPRIRPAGLPRRHTVGVLGLHLLGD